MSASFFFLTLANPFIWEKLNLKIIFVNKSLKLASLNFLKTNSLKRLLLKIICRSAEVQEEASGRRGEVNKEIRLSAEGRRIEG